MSLSTEGAEQVQEPPAGRTVSSVLRVTKLMPLVFAVATISPSTVEGGSGTLPPLLGDLGGDGDDAVGVVPHQPSEPGGKASGLRRVAPPQSLHPLPDLTDHQRAYVRLPRLRREEHLPNALLGSRPLARLGDDVGVQELAQPSSTSRIVPLSRRISRASRSDARRRKSLRPSYPGSSGRTPRPGRPRSHPRRTGHHLQALLQCPPQPTR